jgi:iron complex transport system ATP-binding protein
VSRAVNPVGLPDAAIEVRRLGVSLGGTLVLQAIDLVIPKARWTSIVGPNGAGKSTLLRAMAGLLPRSGEVFLLGQPLEAIAGRDRARQLAWLGQNEGGADELTAYDVTMLGRLPHQAWLAAPSDADRGVVEWALRATQAWEWRRRPLSHLSGGERQRVLLARALAVEAEVLLMDEPLANLDPPHQADWMDLAQALIAKGKTVVSVLHEIGMALHADQMVVMAQGRITHLGACADPATHRALEAVFDHRIEVHALQGQWVAMPRAHASPNRKDIPHAD